MENLLSLGPWALTIMVGVVGFLIREYIKANKEEFKIFKEQLLINADEHREIMISIARLSEHLPDILDCEEDLDKLKGSDSKQWSKLKELDIKVDEHDQKIKKLVA